MKHLTIPLAMSLAAMAFPARAELGDLDTTFGTNGVVTSDVAYGDFFRGLFVDSFDRIYATGFYYTDAAQTQPFQYAIRYTPDGELDTTFGNGGVFQLPPGDELNFTAVTVDAQGRILAVSYPWGPPLQVGFRVARFTDDGNLDLTFGDAGYTAFGTPDFVYFVSGIVVHDDGKIVVGAMRHLDSIGRGCFFLVRFTDEGDLDNSFGTNGDAVGCDDSYDEDYVYSLTVGPEGRTLAGGYSSTPGNRQATTFLADADGTYQFKAHAVGVGEPDYANARVAAMRYSSNKIGMLVIPAQNGLLPSSLHVIGGSALDPATGDVADRTLVSKPITFPADWQYSTLYAFQSDGSIIVTGSVDDGAGDRKAAIARFEGSPLLAPNRAPVAVAGPDQAAAPDGLVELDATGSTDADGDSLTYAWTQTSGPAVTLTGASTATAQFTAPSVAVPTTLTFELTVSDPVGAASVDEISVVVSPPNTAPVAAAGTDQAVDSLALVTLFGTGSTDADGDSLTYSWTQTSGPTVTLTGAATSTAQFTAPSVAVLTMLTFELTVTDPDGADSVDEVSVAVSPLPAPPEEPGKTDGGGLPPTLLYLFAIAAALRRRRSKP